VRYSYNDFYFSDRYEGLPVNGYHAMIESMLASPLIRVELNCDFFSVRDRLPHEALIVYTGPIDRYYEYRFGLLGWRTLDFEIERPPVVDFQGAAVINYPDLDYRFTRIHEFKHFHPERPPVPGTLIMREYPRFAKQGDEPYYPIGTEEDKRRYEQYRELARRETSVVFDGRLGTYRYLDMDQAIAAALKCFRGTVSAWLAGVRPPALNRDTTP
jgi:UDP-galactopyranose mutase